VIAVLLASATAAANPELRSKQEQADAIIAQVHALGEEVGAAAERYNGANYRLQQLSRQLRTTRLELARARSGYRVAQERVARRLVELYTSGEPASALDVILGAESLSDLIDGIEARERVAEQDAAIAAQMREYRAEVTNREQRLRRVRAEQADVVRRRAAERAAIEAKLAERERLLASVRAEIERLRQQERARQARLERQARAALAARQRAAAIEAERETAEAAEQNNEEAASAHVHASEPAASPPPPPPAASRAARVVAIAMRYLGVPYKWGGASPSTGFDCSGLTMYVFAQVGVSLPHYAAAQYQMGIPVSRDQLQPGDLVFFSGLGHMGMYIGGGNFIHAPQTGDVVKISSINEPYRVAGWVGARRVL
jgi:cell wall-associated NlpC family hydrolase